MNLLTNVMFRAGAGGRKARNVRSREPSINRTERVSVGHCLIKDIALYQSSVANSTYFLVVLSIVRLFSYYHSLRLSPLYEYIRVKVRRSIVFTCFCKSMLTIPLNIVFINYSVPMFSCLTVLRCIC